MVNALRRSPFALGEIAEQLQAMRRAVLRYSVTGDEPSFKEAAERESKAIEILQAAAAAAPHTAEQEHHIIKGWRSPFWRCEPIGKRWARSPL